MGKRKSEKLALELAGANSACLGDRHLSWHVVRRLCKIADDKTTCGDQDALRIAQLATRLAGRLLRLRCWRRKPGESLELALAFGQLASALRLANRLSQAETALEIAFEVSPKHFEGVLYRRRACIRLYQGSLKEAKQDAEAAVALALEEDRAMALGTLGAVLYYSGDLSRAATRYEECLAIMDPDDEHSYCGTVVSYVAALGEGTAEQCHKALELCTELRSELKPRHKMQRAKLWWAEGLIKRKLGQLDDAWWALNVARRSLIAMKAVPEIAAIVADMAETEVQPQAIFHICTEASAVISEPQQLVESLQDLAQASRELIPSAASALREQASQLAACPTL